MYGNRTAIVRHLQVVGSVVQYGMLMYVAAGSGGQVTTLSIWLAIKVRRKEEGQAGKRGEGQGFR